MIKFDPILDRQQQKYISFTPIVNFHGFELQTASQESLDHPRTLSYETGVKRFKEGYSFAKSILKFWI